MAFDFRLRSGPFEGGPATRKKPPALPEDHYLLFLLGREGNINGRLASRTNRPELLQRMEFLRGKEKAQNRCRFRAVVMGVIRVR